MALAWKLRFEHSRRKPPGLHCCFFGLQIRGHSERWKARLIEVILLCPLGPRSAMG